MATRSPALTPNPCSPPATESASRRSASRVICRSPDRRTTSLPGRSSSSGSVPDRNCLRSSSMLDVTCQTMPYGRERLGIEVRSKAGCAWPVKGAGHDKPDDRTSHRECQAECVGRIEDCRLLKDEPKPQAGHQPQDHPDHAGRASWLQKKARDEADEAKRGR